ncbi:MAG: D-alanine--D-alanine ligase family protein [Chloroflexota bacterium]
MDSKEKIRVGVLFGGRSGEHAVSLMSARSVLQQLDAEKYDITQIGLTLEGKWLVGEDVLEAFVSGKTGHLSSATLLPDPSRSGLRLLRQDAGHEILETLTELDVVFPVLHGPYGEDGTLQGLLDMADVAYVGAGVLGSSLGMDKGVFKDVMRANGIPVVDYLVVLRSELEADLEEVVGRAEEVAPYPLFTKPANLGSSVAVSKCQSRSDLVEGLMEAALYDRRILVERGVDAREIEVSVLGNDCPIASIPGEIIPAAEFYSYEAKYHDSRSQLIIPAPLSEELIEEFREVAIRAYRAVDCAGMARVDFLLDRHTDKVFLSELNTIPGFTQISMYPKLWEASGIPYRELLDRLIELALERKAERDRTVRVYKREKG